MKNGFLFISGTMQKFYPCPFKPHSNICVGNTCVFKNITTSLSYLNLLKLLIDLSKIHYSLNTERLTRTYFSSGFQVACNKDCIVFNPTKRYCN